jgi:hypothetical protein
MCGVTVLRTGRANSGEFSADPDWNTFSSEKYETGSSIAFAVDLRGLRWGVSSGSSSEGVGKTLKGVFVELFLGVFVVAFAGVAAAPAAVDRLFLGDALLSSSYKMIIRKLR